MIDISTSSKIGQILKSLIKQKGHDAKDIAYATGVSPQSISQLFKADLNIKLSTLVKILDSLGYKIIITPKNESLIEQAEVEENRRTMELIKSLAEFRNEINKKIRSMEMEQFKKMKNVKKEDLVQESSPGIPKSEI